MAASRSAIVFVWKWVLRAAFALSRLLPVADRIVVASASSAPLSGNLEFIRDELARRGLGTRTTVLAAPRQRGILGKLAEAFSAMRAEYYLATSRVFIVDDYFFPVYVITPRPETTIIQTWHASGAFKKIGYSVLDKTFGASESLVSQVRIHSNYDHILMGSESAVPAYSEAFGQPAEKFVTDVGIPRTDLFFDEERVALASRAVRDKYGLPAGKKVLLYAPTFRGTTKHEAAYHDDLDLGIMRDRCADKYILLLRLHPSVAGRVTLPSSLAGFAFDVSDHPDINELMLVSDVLITDYSSAIFEYSLLERPMVFFAPDYEAYEAERGFYFPYTDGVPGPVFTTSEQVAIYVAEGDFDIARVSGFRAASFDTADGRASARFVDRLVVPALASVGTPSDLAEKDPRSS